jgi:hypothetical protein
MAENKPNVVVVSNTTAGGAARDKDAMIKIPKIHADMGTLLTIGGVIVAVGGAYYIVTQLPTIMNTLVPPPAPASGAVVSGAGVTPTQPNIVQQLPAYPGTGAGSYPPPLTQNPYMPGTTGQAYPQVNQQLPLPYPYMTAPGPQTPGTGVVSSYHGMIDNDRYLDVHGKRRRFIGERRVKEIIGSIDGEDDEVFDLIEGE